MRQLILYWSLLLLLPHLALTGKVVAQAASPAQPAFRFDGVIRNAATHRTISADVVIFGSGPDPMGKLQTSPTGTFNVMPLMAGQYRLAVSAMGYVPQEVTVTTAPTPVAVNIDLVPLEVGTKVTLRNIRFEQSKYTLLPESFEELNRLVVLMTENEQLEIQLNGHTDNQGDPQKNVVLSENRVQAVQDYLVSKGIAAGRLRGKGFGGSQPIASNKQEYTRKLNRRVEFEILKN